MAKEKKYHTEINCETGETITREYTAEEYLDAEKRAEEQAKIKAEQEAAEAEQAALKASALTKLAALGLSEDEAKAIIG